ncbi:MAG TPA: hypothetical protein VJ417_13450, partial [Candidatus Glassbacteria bacterium]|nr:hypothetical protein [Candidatus Glassbacteria bacterium]
MTPLVVIFLYLAVTFGIGSFAWWRGRVTADDYYISARSQGYLVTALAIMATFFSAFAMLGAPGMLYQGGIGFVFFMLNVPICGALIWIIGKPLWALGKRHGYITPSDLVADYYNSDLLRVLIALLGIVYIIPYAVLQFKGGGYLFQVITQNSDVHAGWFELSGGMIRIGPLAASTYVFGALLLASITMIYTIMGGMRAVCWTDVFQGGLLVIGMLAGGAITIWKLGGLTGLFESREENFTAQADEGRAKKVAGRKHHGEDYHAAPQGRRVLGAVVAHPLAGRGHGAETGHQHECENHRDREHLGRPGQA